MKLLLDTHVFLWAVVRRTLSVPASSAFLDPENDLYLSAASYWEICIKQSIGKLEAVDNWIEVFDSVIAANEIEWLPIAKAHCQKLIELPRLHGDPFDRLLIAQALCEEMTLLTADPKLAQYQVPILW